MNETFRTRFLLCWLGSRITTTIRIEPHATVVPNYLQHISGKGDELSVRILSATKFYKCLASPHRNPSTVFHISRCTDALLHWLINRAAWILTFKVWVFAGAAYLVRVSGLVSPRHITSGVVIAAIGCAFITDVHSRYVNPYHRPLLAREVALFPTNQCRQDKISRLETRKLTGTLSTCGTIQTD